MGVEAKEGLFMSEPQFKKIAVFGVGLIGGSFALALRKAGVVSEVVGFGRSSQTLAQAQQLGIIDRIGTDLAAELRDTDLILLATPVGQMADIMARIAPHLGTNTLVTDGGSTKSDVVSHAYQQLGSHISRFVPAHPIAGAEKSGAAAARADLYQGKKVVLTPLPENSAEVVARVRQAWLSARPAPRAASCASTAFGCHGAAAGTRAATRERGRRFAPTASLHGLPRSLTSLKFP